MFPKFLLGFSTLEQETDIKELPIQEKVPNWLTGMLLQTSPAKFEIGKQSFQHWFDGLAMLHKFSFNQGKISYKNRFLKSQTYQKSLKEGKISVSGFATEPSRSLWQNLGSVFSDQVNDNANINIIKLGNRFLALTATPNPVEFDPQTLETIENFQYNDDLVGVLTSPYPQYDSNRGEFISYNTNISATSSYNIYRLDEKRIQRELIGQIPVKELAFMHSFAMTEHYVILTEFPFVTNPLSLLAEKLKGKPFIENFTWKPERGTRFLILDKQEGKLVSSYESDAFFALHQINAFEKNGEIIIDLCAYSNSKIIDEFYLEHLKNPYNYPLSSPQFRRYFISLDKKFIRWELMAEEVLDFSRINPKYQTKDYRFVYGVGRHSHYSNDYFNQLIKIDIHNQSKQIWFHENCYPGAPTFVSSPNAQDEDEGVILSLVLDVDKKTSFLLILDAKNLAELGRADLLFPIPFGFYNQYF